LSGSGRKVRVLWSPAAVAAQRCVMSWIPCQKLKTSSTPSRPESKRVKAWIIDDRPDRERGTVVMVQGTVLTGQGATLMAQGTVLLVQGTASDAGKSTLVAGRCRLLARRQVRVAPFKPQNMALNSAVTADGGEIGRAQALQAIACGLQPHTDMNPVLIKPASDTGAQIIIQGRALQNMEAQAYHLYKPRARQAVLDSFSRLRDQYQAVMVEGAGSPAEINLRDGDIANMGFAEAVDCPVILV